MHEPLPPPERPEFQPRPLAAYLWWLIVGTGGLMLLALVAFLASPVLWVAFAIASIIGLQYFTWGWWFERVYRSNLPPDDRDAP
jgi:hypothetical protein